jgi:hypothetical protein
MEAQGQSYMSWLRISSFLIPTRFLLSLYIWYIDHYYVYSYVNLSPFILHTLCMQKHIMQYSLLSYALNCIQLPRDRSFISNSYHINLALFQNSNPVPRLTSPFHTLSATCPCTATLHPCLHLPLKLYKTWYIMPNSFHAIQMGEWSSLYLNCCTSPKHFKQVEQPT